MWLSGGICAPSVGVLAKVDNWIDKSIGRRKTDRQKEPNYLRMTVTYIWLGLRESIAVETGSEWRLKAENSSGGT